MNQEAKQLWAFLRAVEANPRDAATRLAFADFLEECDEPEEADAQRAVARDIESGRFDAERRLRKAADEFADGDYEGMVKGCVAGDYTFATDSFRYDLINDAEFWDDIEKVAGATVGADDDRRLGIGFNCAC